MINIIPEKNIAFINYTDIMSAIKAVEMLKKNSELEKYKISFGKDRCGRNKSYVSESS